MKLLIWSNLGIFFIGYYMNIGRKMIIFIGAANGERGKTDYFHHPASADVINDNFVDHHAIFFNFVLNMTSAKNNANTLKTDKNE
jgi:hypothetical protein